MRKRTIEFTSDNTESYNQLFTLTELQNLIFKSNNSAPGPDEIHYTLLKELSKISLKYLLDIYNNIWISGYIPTKWKQAITIPILKKQKDPTNPTSHRPIALTSCSCKTLKRMINLRLTRFLDSNNRLSNLQTSFRTKSTIDQIVRIETIIRETFIKKEHLVAVLFDLEKPYDTTWPYGILNDLSQQGRLPFFFKHFLEDWTPTPQIWKTGSSILYKTQILLIQPDLQLHPQPQIWATLWKKEKSIKPFGLQMTSTLKESNISLNNIHESILPQTPPWIIKKPKVIFKLNELPKTKPHSVALH